MAVWGYAQGLIVGRALAGRVRRRARSSARGSGRCCSRRARSSPYAPLFALLGALLIGGVFAVGVRDGGLPPAPARSTTGWACSTAWAAPCWWRASGSCLAWIGGAVALQTPGARELREPIQRSAILTRLNERLPPSGALLQALARFDPFPQIDGPASRTCGPPDARIARDPAGARARAQRGAACSARPAGSACRASGWVAGDGLVVTNAHVVAGPGRHDGPGRRRGRAARRRRDLVRPPQRPRAAAGAGPGGRAGPAAARGRAAPAPRRRSSAFPRTARTTSRPAGSGHDRTVADAGRLRPRAGAPRDHLAARPGALGQLGRPDGRRRGRVVTTIFAATVSDSGRSGFGVPDGLVAQALDRARGAVDTGPCA